MPFHVQNNFQEAVVVLRSVSNNCKRGLPKQKNEIMEDFFVAIDSKTLARDVCPIWF